MPLVASDGIRCEGCGVRFDPPAVAQGPRRRYHSPACRKDASRRRRHAELAALIADEGLAAGHGRLAAALAALPASGLRRVRAALARPSERKVSPDLGDGFVEQRHNGPGTVVGALHTPKEG
jgi:hypothetical protein